MQYGIMLHRQEMIHKLVTAIDYSLTVSSLLRKLACLHTGRNTNSPKGGYREFSVKFQGPDKFLQ